MLTELNLDRAVLNFAITKEEPDPFVELRTVLKELFRYSGIDTTIDISNKVSHLFLDDPKIPEFDKLMYVLDVYAKASQVNNRCSNTLFEILEGNDPQKCVNDLNTLGMLRVQSSWEVMNEICDYQFSPDPRILLSILNS